MMKKFMFAAVIIFAGILSGVLVYIHNSKNDGTTIQASIEGMTENAVYFCQKDPIWKDDTLGDSSYHMEDSGCLTSCIAAAINMQNIQIDNINSEVTPGTLNQYFSDNNVYDKDGNILWNELENAINVNVVLKDAVDLADDELDTIIEKGYYPIVRVKMPSSGNYHYVLIIGADNGSYLCMDPLDEKSEPVSLSEFENVIYAVRYIETRK